MAEKHPHKQRLREYILFDALAKSHPKGRGSFEGALRASVDLCELAILILVLKPEASYETRATVLCGFRN